MNYDIAIIGAGPGGYTAAIRAAQLGKKVAIIERSEIGGTCLNNGCIPTKTLHASAKLFSRMKKSEKFGINARDVSMDISKVIDRKNSIVSQLRKGLEYLFKEYKIDLIRGDAAFMGDHQITVNGQIVESPKIILASGSTITENPPFKIDEKKVFSSNGILELRAIPKSMAVIGAGPMGIELACIFNAMGSKVAIFEVMDRILPQEDAEIARSLHESLKRSGIEINCGQSLKDTDGFEVILVSIGRKLNTDGFEKAGIKIDNGKVAVNEKMETSITGVYAVGDIVGRYMFAHTAAREGIVAAENACGLPAGRHGKKSKMDYAAVPRCIYSDPGVAAVGMSEEAAISKLGAGKIKIGRFPFRASSKSLIEDERDGFIKVIADSKDKILGIHIVGGNATEIIGEAALAINKGMKVEDIIETIHAHPTVYESIQEAAANVLKQAISIINK
jgi:dihydrolipoamide dehydrogenase